MGTAVILTGRIRLTQELRQFVDGPNSILEFPIAIGSQSGQGLSYDKGHTEVLRATFTKMGKWWPTRCLLCWMSTQGSISLGFMALLLHFIDGDCIALYSALLFV